MKADLTAKFDSKKSAYEAIMVPKVESVSAINLNTIEVKFNKAVDSTDATNTANYQIDGGALVGSIALSSDKKTATITLTAPATINTYKTVSVNANAINVDGSTTVYVPAKSQAVYFTDSVAPTLSGVSYSPDGEVLTVKFSETLLSKGTIKVYDENNLEVADETDFSAAGKSITLDTSAGGVNLTNNKSYKIVIVGATDLAGNFFAGNRVETTFKKEKTDTVAPSFSSASVINNKTVRVTFSEAVQANAVTGKVADLSIDGAAPISLTVVDGTPAVAGEATEVSPGVYDVLLSATQLASGAHSVALSNYKDIQGNATATATTKTFQINADTTAASLTKTEVNTTTKVVTLTFNEDVVLGTAAATLITPDNVHISIPAGAFGTVVGNSKQVTVNLSSYVTNPVVGAYQLQVASGSVSDGASTPNTQAYNTSLSLTTDSSKPTVTGVTVQAALGNDTVEVVYSEDMGASATDVNNYLVDGQRVFQSAIFDGDRQTVKLTFKAGAFDVTGNRVLTIENVADAAGNVMNKETRTAVSYSENTKPTIVSATLIDLDTVRVTFSEAGVLNFTGLDDVEFYANGSTTAIAAGTVTPVTGNTKAFDVDFATGSSVTDLSKAIQLKVLSGNNVVDGAGNVLGTTGTINITQ
jgi:trimeric autotransporter adhesin